MGTIYTFYSYKGGVGRSMALANIADLFYQLGLKVLIVDWNLEAPGIERFFPLDLNKALANPGLINLLLKYKENMSRVLPEGALPFEPPDAYLVDVYPEAEGSGSVSRGRLQLLTAGQRAGATDFAGYAELVRDFDWNDFYDNWEARIYFDWLRERFQSQADVILLDSRTGVAEMEGAGAYQLADAVVLFCSPSAQSLDGTAQVARSLAGPTAVRRRKSRPLQMLLVPSRVEGRAEAPLIEAFHDRFREAIEEESLRPYLSAKLGDDPNLLWNLRIPYAPSYAFAETLAVREPRPEGGEELAGAYANLLLAMAHLIPSDLAPDNAAYQALAHAVKSLGDSHSLSPLLPLDIGVSALPFTPPPPPYPGMAPYTAENGHFYGRAVEIRRIVQHLRNSRFLLLAGPSSAGKSSLLEAGVVPAVLSSAYWPAGFWAVLDMRRGTEALRSLSELLGEDLSDPAQAVTSWLKSHSPAQRLLLVVDQIEELLLQGDAKERKKFTTIVNKLRESDNCTLIVSLRSDMYPDLMASDLWPINESDRMEIVPLEGDNLRKAIRQPALDVGVTVEPALVERLVADSANEPGRMPLLQETLLILWDSIERRRITLSAYEKLGGPAVTGLAAAMDRKADKIWAGLDPGQQRIAKRIFIRLVQFGFGRPDTRRQQSEDELRADGDDPQLFENTLTALAKGRLLVLGIQRGSRPNETGDKTTVDIAHEALIQGWHTLQGWVGNLETRDNERTRRRLEERAAKWAELGRQREGLLNLADSQVAEDWLHSESAKELGYSALLAELVAASRAAWEADKRAKEKRQRRAIKVFATLTAIALVFAVVAFLQRREAENSAKRADREERTSRAKARAGQSLVERDPELSLLLALDAVSTTRSHGELVVPEAEEALHQALLNSHVRQTFVDDEGPNNDTKASITGVAYSPVACKDLTSPECYYIFSTDANGIIRVWSSSNGKLVRRFQHVNNIVPGCIYEGPQKPDEPRRINNIAFSSNGRFIITAGDDCAAEVWEAEQFWDPSKTPKPISTLTHTKQIWNAAFNKEGTKAVTASGDGTVKVWDLDSNGHLSPNAPIPPLIPSQPKLEGVADAKFSPDGRYIATASSDHRAALWDATLRDATAKIASSTPITYLIGHTGPVWSVAFSNDGKLLVTSSDDGTVRVWDVSDVSSVRLKSTLVPSTPNNGLNRAAFSPDGRYVFAVGDGRKAIIWRVEDSNEIVTLLGHREPVNAAAFSMDGSRIATASYDGTVRVWDWNTSGGEELPTLAVSSVEGRGINDVSFSRDGQHLVTANEDGHVTVWEVITGSSGITMTARQVYTATQGDSVNTAVYDPDGKSILIASDDTTVRIWNPQDDTFSSLTMPDKSPVVSARYSPSGKRIVTVTAIDEANKIPSKVFVWDPDPKDQTRYNSTRLSLPGEHITCAIFDPSGDHVATCSDKGPNGYLRVWDVSSTALQVGTSITTPIATRRAHFGPVMGADWREKIVTAGEDWKVELWNGDQPFEQQTNLLGHRNTVTDAAFNREGDQLVTVSTDYTVKLWKIAKGDMNVIGATTLRGQEGSVQAATFSPDGKIVATAGEDGTVRFYLNDINLLVALAKSRITRDFTPEEKASYLGIPLPTPTAIPGTQTP